MISFRLPFVNLPTEYLTLLKSNLSISDSPAPVFEGLRHNRALYTILERAFKEFDDGRGVEKVMMALGWPNFRERFASIYIYKAIYGSYPERTDMNLVEDIRNLEQRFVGQSIHTCSRLFLLGLYFTLANVGLNDGSLKQKKLFVPEEVDPIMRLSQGRSEKIDWLILLIMHFVEALGTDKLTGLLKSGSNFEDIYSQLELDSRVLMNQNMLAYSASIRDPDILLYDKI